MCATNARKIWFHRSEVVQRSRMSHEKRTREDPIILTGGYPQLMVVVGQRMLADHPERLHSAPVLILPAAQMPFAYLFASRTKHYPIFIADQRLENLTWQRQKLPEGKGFYVLVGVNELPIEVRGVGVVVNPFGLQHDLPNAPRYASLVRERCLEGAMLQTLDWGVNRYPDAIAQLPGIAADIHYSAERLLEPYGTETGWRLIQEHEIPFSLPSTIESIAEKLGEAEATYVRTTFTQDILVESSVCYRSYEAF